MSRKKSSRGRRRDRFRAKVPSSRIPIPPSNLQPHNLEQNLSRESVTMTANDKNKYSVELPDTYTSDRGGIRRGDVLTHPELGVDGVQSLYEGLRRGLALNPLGPCLGFRAMSSSGFPTPFIYSSYTECVARVDSFAAGLDCLNLVEKNPDGMVLVSATSKW